MQTTSATAEESAAASEELSGQAAYLKEMVGQFHLRGSQRTIAKAGTAAHKVQLPAGKAQNSPRISLDRAEFGKY